VSLNNISTVDLASTNTTVIGALRTWETTHGPAIRPVTGIKKSVLLLKTEPWLLCLVRLHELGSLVAVVELVGSSIGIPALSDDQNVWGATEWVREDSNGSQVDIGVVAWCLASRATVEVPLWEIFDLELTALGDLGESLESKALL